MWRHPLRLLAVALVPCLPACDDEAVRPAGGPPVAGLSATHADGMAGAELAAVLGCGACHPGAPGAAGAAGLALDDLADRWAPADLSAYLQEPVPLREGVVARMPDFHLDPAEAAAVTLHLMSRGAERPPRGARAGLTELAREHPEATADRGARIVEVLNCSGCHPGLGDARPVAPTLAGAANRLLPEWVRRYLAAPTAVRPAGHPAGSGSRMPDFRLSGAEADSLSAWIAGGAGGAAAAAREAPAAPSASRHARAEALLRNHLSCLGCHRVGTDGGRIGPALDGAAARLRPDYLRRVVHDPQRATPGTIMPRPLEDSATLALVVDYLLHARPPGSTGGAEDAGGAGGTADAPDDRAGYVSLLELELEPELEPGPGPGLEPRAGRTGSGPAAAFAVSAAGTRDGAALYGTHCAACHGVRGAGDGFNAPHLPARPTAHADGSFMATRPDATLFDGIHAGGHILGRSHRMPAFGGSLSAGEIRALVAHLRALCACEEPGWASP